jgi:hypothetical protein
MMGTLFKMANNGELTNIVLRGGDDFAALPRLARARFRFHSMFVLSFNQNVFQQHKIGALHADDWDSFGADLVSCFDMKGARQAWPGIKRRFNPDFQAHVEQIIAQAAHKNSELVHPFGTAEPATKTKRRKPPSQRAAKA